MSANTKGILAASVPISSMIMVASVQFGSHAGSGFASGNQADKYFIQTGYVGILTPIIAIALMTLVAREAIAMYNNHKCKNYVDLYKQLYHPYDKLAVIFEVWFNIMVLVSASSVLAGAAELLKELNILPYIVTAVLVAIVLLFLVIFGETVVAKASTFFTVIILITCFAIFFSGIAEKGIPTIVGNIKTSGAPQGHILPILSAFSYAGFCLTVLPSLITTGKILKNRRNAGGAMLISFFMNLIPLMLSVLMLFGWSADYRAAGRSTLPTLFITEQLGSTVLFICYNVCLFLCMVSTGVTTTFGFVSRFYNHEFLKKRITSSRMRSLIVAVIALSASTLFSLVGLDKVVNYGYRYMGYIGTIITIIPFLTIGRYKNKKFDAEQQKSESIIEQA